MAQKGSRPILLQFRDFMDSTRGERTTLEDNGCRAMTLLPLLFSCVKPPAELRTQLVSASTDFRGYKKRIAKLAKSMKLVANEYRAVKLDETLGAYIVDGGIALEDLIEIQAGALESTLGTLQKKSRNLLTDDLPLCLLSAYVMRTTGKRHYPEIASLLTALSCLVGRQQGFFPDTLSKKVRRFEQKFGGALERAAKLSGAIRTKA